MKVAIHRKNGARVHSNSWSVVWVEQCKRIGIDYSIVDCFEDGVIPRLSEFDILLFHFGNYAYNDMKHARSILYSAKAMGLKVFPDYFDAWHFDDKIAESFLLESIGAPIPGYHTFFSKKDFHVWLNSHSKFPIIAKLKSGSGSHNVKMISSREEAQKYASVMFGRGYSSSPNLFLKASSNIRSARSFLEFKRRFKRIPEFLITLKRSSEFENEKGYIYLQEFVENAGYDIKVAVVGEKVSYFARRVRSGDFRASGGADFYYNRSHIPDNVVESALSVAKKLGVQCMGFDYVVNSETGQGLIVEMSYGFAHKAVIGAGGHWNVNGQWIEEPLNAPAEILDNMLLGKF